MVGYISPLADCLIQRDVLNVKAPETLEANHAASARGDHIEGLQSGM